jgi:hypothetical protein
MSYILVIVYSLSEVKEIEGKMRRAVPKWEAGGQGGVCLTKVDECNREWLLKNPLFLKKTPQPRGRKCPSKSATSFIGHPSAMKSLRISRE